MTIFVLNKTKCRTISVWWYYIMFKKCFEVHCQERACESPKWTWDLVTDELESGPIC